MTLSGRKGSVLWKREKEQTERPKLGLGDKLTIQLINKLNGWCSKEQPSLYGGAAVFFEDLEGSFHINLEVF
jgi:hypothetical protein